MLPQVHLSLSMLKPKVGVNLMLNLLHIVLELDARYPISISNTFVKVCFLIVHVQIYIY